MFVLKKSERSAKKWQVTLPDGRTVHFGAQGYEDYTQHKDKRRRLAYIARHRKREEWGSAGLDTPGFWSRWLLWGEPTIAESIAAIQRQFNIRISRR